VPEPEKTKPEDDAKSPPTVGRTAWDAQAEIGTTVVNAVLTVSLRVLDKAGLTGLGCFLVLVILGLLAWRVPESEITKIPKVIQDSVSPVLWTMAIVQTVTIALMVLAFKMMRSNHRKTVERIAAEKAALEALLDPSGPRLTSTNPGIAEGETDELG